MNDVLPGDVTPRKIKYRPPDKVFSSYIRKKMPAGTTHVVTIRLDNDDIVHPEYVSSIVEYSKHLIAKNSDEKDFLINMPFGLRYDGRSFSAILYPNGPFQARVEAATNPQILTAYHGNHGRFFEHQAHSNIMTDCPMWIQLIHEKNVSNSFSPGNMQFSADCTNNVEDLFKVKL